MRLTGRQWNMILVIFTFLMLFGILFGIYLYSAEKEKNEVLSRICPEGVLIYGADQNAPPLRFVDEDGAYKGVVVDLMNQLSLEMGIEVKTVPYLWEDALTALKSGETDLCDMFMNEERRVQYAYTDPIYTLRTVLAVSEETRYTLQDVNRMRIATQKGDFANAYLRKHYPSAELVYVPDVLMGMELLAKGGVDAVIGDEPVVYYAISKSGKNGQFKMINTALYEEDVVLAVHKEKAELIPILNSAISNIKRKGQLEKIQQKWFGISTPLLKSSTKRELLRSLSLPILAVIAALVLFIINNRALKRQVRQRTAELEESRNELRMIFDELSEFIVVVDKDKTIINVNQGLLACVEQRNRDVIGKNCCELLFHFCGDCADCIIDQCMSAKGSVGAEVSLERDVYEMTAHPVESIQQGALITFRNISMEKIQRNQLLQSTKMMAIGQLAAGMAHEIRNPLGIIRTQSYLLRGNGELAEKEVKSLDFIDANVKRASGIIDNVMNFWRVSEDKAEVLNLREQMQSIIALQQDAIKKKEIHVELSCQGNCQVYSSGETLKHILLNLTSNAFDAMDEGGCLRLNSVIKETSFTVICQDDGCGIDQKNIENLFNPFFTTKEPGKGTGLGLFIVYSEVQRLGGTISVESQVGQGARFTIVIPQNREERQDETRIERV